jgi:hypothetical protein
MVPGAVPFRHGILIGNLRLSSAVPVVIAEKDDASEPMDDEVEKFRHYAAECRRLAAKAAAKDKAILLELAEAWMACAAEAERKARDRKS